MAIQALLSSEKAFYTQLDYLDKTEKDMKAESVPISYRWNTEYKITTFAKQLFALIIFPIAIYQFLSIVVGKIFFLPSSTPSLLKLPKNHAQLTKAQIPLDKEWKFKRLNVEVDGYQIDAMIVGKVSTIANGRWILNSNGNGEFYENGLLYDHTFKKIATELDANGIVFNYPGVGASSGLPNREAMAKAYRAILNFLEDKKNGIGAKEIIGYGHSIGGGVQGDALNDHNLKKDIKYVFIKSRTFSDLSATTTHITKIEKLGKLTKFLGWNISSVESSKKLPVPEIILQTIDTTADQEEIHDSSKIIHDSVIPAESSLAKALLDDPNCSKKNKVFIGVKAFHNDPINVSFLVPKINNLIQNQ